jgi:hypothetical protein
LLGVSCEAPDRDRVSSQSGPTAPSEPAIDTLAERYVRLALAFGRHDDSYVDAYFGPPDWREAALAAATDLVDLQAQAEVLIGSLQALDVGGAPAIERARHAALVKRVAAMRLRMAMVAGESLPFDEESAVLFDAVAPDRDAPYFQAVLDEIAALLPGAAPLPERIEEFRKGYEIPMARLDAVFKAAIAECRSRTLERLELPPGESFRIEYVTDKPWSGYNWYQGNAFSLIEINTDLPIYIGRALDLGCHEGYPGHHTQNALLEQHLVKERGWVEYTLVPLYGPQALISEGSANYGLELAFPGEERLEFERDVLFPLAGLDPSTAARYRAVTALVEKLDYADNEAARDYLNGTITAPDAVDWLVTYALASRERAEQRVRFIETYRSYVINYNLGQDLVREFVERDSGGNPAAQWAAFERLLSTPFTPSDLVASPSSR